jgi:hypothetical protein
MTRVSRPASRVATLTLALIFSLLGLLPQALSRTLPDIAFPLWAAERMQHGARLYVDILEINPPLFVWLDLPLVWLSRVTGLGAITWYRIATSLLLFASLAGCWWALTRSLGDEKVEYRRVLWLAAAFALLLLPRLDWGEREHLSLALTLPYIFLGIARARGRAVPRGGAVLAGIAAGIGIAFKPHFVLVWLGREVAVWSSVISLRSSTAADGAEGRRPVLSEAKEPTTDDRRPEVATLLRLGAESISVPLLCIAYLAAVIIIHPEYFHLLRELGAAYQSFLRNSVLITLFLGDGSAIVLGALIVALALRQLPKHAAVWRVLIGSMLGYFLAAVIQAKGWRYHFYPSLGLALLLFAAMAWDARRATNGMVGKAVIPAKAGTVIPAKAGIHDLMRLFAAIPAAALATAVIVSAALAVRQTAHPLNPRYDPDPSIGQLIPLLRERAGGQPVFVISPNMASGFPLTNYAGTEWPSRLSNMWPPVVAYDSATRAPGPVQFGELNAMDPIERFGLETTVHDFSTSRPAMVLSLIAVDQPGWGMQRLDLLRWLQRDPDFNAAWMAYDSLGRVGNYTVWGSGSAGFGKLLAVHPVRSPSSGASPPGAIHVSYIGLASLAVFVAVLLLQMRRGLPRDHG